MATFERFKCRSTIEQFVRVGDVLGTVVQSKPFTVASLNDQQWVLVAGRATQIKLPWETLEGALHAIATRESMEIGGSQGGAGKPGTLDNFLKYHGVKVRASNYVAALFVATGLAQVDIRQPATISASASFRRTGEEAVHVLGRTYVPASRESSNTSGALMIDLEKLDRASAEHAEFQNEIADFLTRNWMDVLSPQATTPKYDLAWLGHTGFQVCEVKTTREENEVQQIRLGLGQVLDYRAALRESEPRCGAVLALTEEPRAARLLEVCDSVDVLLVWRGRLEPLLSI